MALTLGNDLTGLVAREVDAAGRTASGLGESLTTGNDKFVEVVDSFLGNSLRDGEIVLGAVAKNTAYSINMLTITDEYLKTVATSLQEGLNTIGSAGPLSLDKLAVLQKNLTDKRTQVDLLIQTADFDGKKLLGGGIKSIDVQVGLSVTDKLELTVTDFASGKLFRSSITKALNEWVAASAANTTYYANAGEITTDLENNVNLVSVALANAGGSGTGGAMTVAELGDGLAQLTATQKTLLDQIAPTAKAFMTNANAGVTFTNATNVQLTAMLGDANSLAEVTAIIQDNAATDISGSQATDVARTAARVLAQDVFQTALNSIRAEQAGVANQKSNVIGSADALRATTNVTQKAADSYLKTDYVLTAQQYSETIRTMVAAITSLQAANKIPEAAQRLVDALAR
ncbi:MAG: hypothetical protein Tsb006_4360 [Rickettsiaceae bacterium]